MNIIINVFGEYVCMLLTIFLWVEFLGYRICIVQLLQILANSCSSDYDSDRRSLRVHLLHMLDNTCYFVVFFYFNNFVGHVVASLHCISLMSNEIELFVICLLVIQISLKCLLSFLSIFKLGCCLFIFMSFKNIYLFIHLFSFSNPWG